MKNRYLVSFLVSAALLLASCETAAILALNRAKVTDLKVEGDKLYVMDLLNSKTFGQMQEIISANPQVDTLVFTAMPGSIDDEVTFKMGRWIRSKELNTHLTAQSVIASGAVDLFVSGSNGPWKMGQKLVFTAGMTGLKRRRISPETQQNMILIKTILWR